MRAAAALTVAALVALTAGCASAVNGEPTSGGASTSSADSSSAPDTSWMPTTLHTSTVQVSDGGTANLTVGDLVTFVGPSSVNMSVDPQDLDLATFYGDPDTLLMLQQGTLTITFPNYDKHFDCANGPCAHPNAPLHMTVTVGGSGSAPTIPDPVDITAMSKDRTVHLVPGQRVTLPRNADLSQFPGGEIARQWTSDSGTGGAALVAYRPGKATYSPSSGDSGHAPILTLIVDAP